jgi:hypothetical protein
MNKSLSLVLIAILAFGIGIAYAAPMLIVPNIELYPRVFEGPKALFNVDVVYAGFNTTDYQLVNSETNPDTNVNYYVVLNITNTADTPATIYEINFAAAQNVTVHDSILGGTIYGSSSPSDIGSLGGFRHFGGVVEGVYLQGKWVNTTWMPSFSNEVNGTSTQAPYPIGPDILSEASWYGGIISGPLTPENVAAFTADHTINATIPSLPANANDTGTWFEGVPITEYYDVAGNPLVAMMYINGGWVDVTGKVTVDQTQPMLTATDMILNQVVPLGPSPYQNMNSSIGQITTLPTWGDWGYGGAYYWFPWDWSSQLFNNTFAPHESRLIVLNQTQATGNLAALQSGNIVLYASASNYITNKPVNGTYLNTVSTTTQVKQVQLQQTDNRYLYNAILADNQIFQSGNSAFEVIVAPRTEP